MKRLRIIDHGNDGNSSDRTPNYIHENMMRNPVRGYSREYDRDRMPDRDTDYDYDRRYENDDNHIWNRSNRSIDRNPGHYSDYRRSRNSDYRNIRNHNDDYGRHNDFRDRNSYSRESRRDEHGLDDNMSDDMEEYLSKHGWHFSKKLCDYAVSKMEKKEPSGESVSFRPLTKEQVDALLKQNNIVLDNDEGYDSCYVANMAKADYYGSSIVGEANLAKFIKDYIDDYDGYEGLPLRRYYSDCEAKGEEIPWAKMI